MQKLKLNPGSESAGWNLEVVQQLMSPFVSCLQTGSLAPSCRSTFKTTDPSPLSWCHLLVLQTPKWYVKIISKRQVEVYLKSRLSSVKWNASIIHSTETLRCIFSKCQYANIFLLRVWLIFLSYAATPESLMASHKDDTAPLVENLIMWYCISSHWHQARECAPEGPAASTVCHGTFVPLVTCFLFVATRWWHLPLVWDELRFQL